VTTKKQRHQQETHKKTKLEKQKLKDLNQLEHTFSIENNVPKDLLRKENLTHEQVAMAKLLMLVADKKGTYRDNLNRFKQILMATKINKQELRELCFQDEIQGELSKIENNFDERRERKIAQKLNQRARMKKLRR
jgi:hypothetical protein